MNYRVGESMLFRLEGREPWAWFDGTIKEVTEHEIHLSDGLVIGRRYVIEAIITTAE